MNFTTFYLLLCIIFAGRGDERWKKRTRENSYIVGALDETGENSFDDNGSRIEMDRELWQYENFGVDTENKLYTNVNYKLPKHKKHLKRLYKTKHKETEKRLVLDNFINNSLYISNHNNISKEVSIDLKHRVKDSKNENTVPEWPKFEDILLSVGVEYDFKSDRWIKLKKKLKIHDKTIKHLNNEVTHQKHEFKYRTIRINGSKKRKNIIIALTAIR